jgi:GNAT superfamily N-acetyltransferase
MIREGQKDDIPAIVTCVHNVMKETWKRYERGYYPKKAIEFDMTHFSEEHAEETISTENAFLFVAEEENIVGVIHGRIFDASKFGLIHWLGVDFAHQNKGIGRQLLERVFAYGQENAIHKISLYTLPVLRPAISLYLKTGFVPEAYLRKQWWGVDFIFMSTWL